MCHIRITDLKQIITIHEQIRTIDNRLSNDRMRRFNELFEETLRATPYIVIGLGWITTFCFDNIEWPRSLLVPTAAFMFSAYHLNFSNSIRVIPDESDIVKRRQLTKELQSKIIEINDLEI
jgi:hypothetical protein